jgi:hypothetical protein
VDSGSVVEAVKRLTRDYVRRAFGSSETDKEALEQRRREVEAQTMTAREAIAELPSDTQKDLINPVAVAVREGLRERGLPEKPGDRVQRVVEVQVRVLLG